MARSKTNKVTVSEATARSVRGVTQGGASWTIIEAIEAFELYDFTERQYGIAIVILGGVIAWVQNRLENKRGKGFFLRDVPPKTTTVGGS